MSRGLNQITRRTNAQRFMVSGYRLKYSNSQVRELLQSAGLGYNNALFTRDMANIRATNPVLPRLTKVGKAIVADSVTKWPMLTKGFKRYQYYYTVQGRNPETGRFEKRIQFSFTSPVKLSRSIADQIALATPINSDTTKGTPDYQTLSAPTIIKWSPIN